ncbi:putative DEAD-box ATP-dependent RNA helicase 42 isoform X1 [Apostichopus japonicus]|uniref:Zinc finger CCHC domain-containing protein 17 n=1 Tax=Stichopus japonicus TaxID=307972 RepID=A0A2G8LLA6_STIJA|nr:putative DEAD-box ATP-dependent RNA helicase 42 isoform X1 [Apostichopus japonicus]
MESINSRLESDKMLPSLYSIFKGEVASLQTYGVFVRIPGCRKNGLVHKTQISKMRVDNPSEVLEVGDNVYCKVISLGEAGEDKISLSMKVVNQDNGKDLDQNLVVTKQEEQRRKKGLPPVQNKIELGAILNTVCRKCGTTGHLTIDCFKLPGDKTYDLVPELDLDSMVQPLVESGGKDKKKKKKKKKDKHQKKQKKRRPTSKDVESSSEEERREGKGNREKNKKRKKMDSSEDTSESSSGEEVVRPNKRNERDKKKDRNSDWRHEDIQMREKGHSSEHKRKSSSASEEQSRDRRGKKRDHSIRDDDRWQEKHHKSSSKHHGSSKYDDQTDEHNRRHSDDHRYKDTYHHGDRR